MPHYSLIILAAGLGKRMGCSDKPKVLFPLAGRALLGYVLETARALSSDITVVAGPHSYEAIQNYIDTQDKSIHRVTAEAKGTGYALSEALKKRASTLEDEIVLVLLGDVPFLKKETLRQMLDAIQDHAMAILTFEHNQPTGYGRVVLSEQGSVEKIIEEKDASPSEKNITCCYGGILAIKRQIASCLLENLTPSSVTGEYYLTHCVEAARQKGWGVARVQAPFEELLGINTLHELADAEALMQERLRYKALQEGVRMDAPSTVYLSYDTHFGANVHLKPFVVIGTGVRVGDNSIIGPFAHIRPDTHIGIYGRIGNFVEIKNSHLGDYVKISHLAYVGDAQIGSRVTIGAGSITCNFDGQNKHMTIVEAEVFIGSNVALVAPLRIGKGAVIGAGSTIVRDVSPHTLALGRSHQVEKAGRKEPCL